MKKRYALVRVDRYPICPLGFKHKCKDFVKTGICDCKHGDTKEQLVAKMAQVIFKAKLERYRRVWKCECSKMEKKDRYKDSLTLAKEIVEFLGVK